MDDEIAPTNPPSTDKSDASEITREGPSDAQPMDLESDLYLVEEMSFDASAPSIWITAAPLEPEFGTYPIVGATASPSLWNAAAPLAPAITYSLDNDFFEKDEMFVIKKEHDGPSNEKGDELIIHRQKAVCRHCWAPVLMRKETLFNVTCECTKICLIHEKCKDKWSQEQGHKCLHCDKEIDWEIVVLFSYISGENPAPERHWWCFWKKGKK